MLTQNCYQTIHKEREVSDSPSLVLEAFDYRVKGLHFGSSDAIVLSIFALCVVMETLVVMVLRKYPKVGWLIGL